MSNYQIDDIIYKFQQNCKAIYREKNNCVEIYEAGLIAKMQKDYQTGKITDEETYIQQLKRLYKSLEISVNNSLEQELNLETKKFSQALSSFFIMQFVQDKKIVFDQNIEAKLHAVLTKIKTQKIDKLTKQADVLMENKEIPLSSTQIIVDNPVVSEEPVEITSASMKIELNNDDADLDIEIKKEEQEVSQIFNEINNQQNETKKEDTIDEQFDEIQSLINEIKGML